MILNKTQWSWEVCQRLYHPKFIYKPCPNCIPRSAIPRLYLSSKYTLNSMHLLGAFISLTPRHTLVRVPISASCLRGGRKVGGWTCSRCDTSETLRLVYLSPSARNFHRIEEDRAYMHVDTQTVGNWNQSGRRSVGPWKINRIGFFCICSSVGRRRFE